MGTLKVEDVIALSIFKCEVCRRRLRSPVFQVAAFGNICGICHAVSVYTNVQRNIKIEMFLSKLYIPCNFAEHGCSYEGPYDKTITHEEICRFRRRKCPVGYQLDCEFEFVNSDDIIEHIRRVHKKNILKVENNSIELKNPEESCKNLFYLLEAENVLILLRTMLKPAKDRTYYISYHFGQEVLSLSLEFKERQVILTTVHESEFNTKFDTRNASKIMLEECELLVRVRVSIQNEEICRNSDDILPLGKPVGSQCSGCSKICEKEILYCEYCYKVACRKCQPCPGCEKSNFSAYRLERVAVSFAFPCKHIGCQQIIPVNVYDVHCLYQCSFNTTTCKLEGCQWTGCFKKMVKHTLEKHLLTVNKKIYSLETDTPNECYFVNGDDVFFHKCVVSTQNELDIMTAKLTEPHWSNSFTWTIKMKSILGSITFTGDYTINRSIRKVNVGEYMNGNTLTLETYIRRN